jgi:hypothetical protein
MSRIRSKTSSRISGPRAKFLERLRVESLQHSPPEVASAAIIDPSLATVCYFTFNVDMDTTVLPLLSRITVLGGGVAISAAWKSAGVLQMLFDDNIVPGTATIAAESGLRSAAASGKVDLPACTTTATSIA